MTAGRSGGHRRPGRPGSSLLGLPCLRRGPARAASDAVSRALLDAARQSAGVGDWASATAYLAEAASQDPGDSDVLYLGRSSQGEAGASPRRRARRPERGARGRSISLLSGARRVHPQGRDPRTGTPLEGSLGRSRAVFLGLGRRSLRSCKYARAPMPEWGHVDAFVAELRDAFARFPDDPAFPRLFLSRAEKIPSSEASRELGKTILSRLSRYSTVDPELPVLAAPLMADISSKRDAVLAYRAAGGSSPAATLRALEYGIIDEAAAARRTPFGFGPGRIAGPRLPSRPGRQPGGQGRDRLGTPRMVGKGRVGLRRRRNRRGELLGR